MGDDPTPEPAEPITVVVTLTEEASADLEPVRAALESAGFEVEQLLEFIGQIVGKVPGDGIEALRAIDGVAAVEESREIQLPPSDSMLQ